MNRNLLAFTLLAFVAVPAIGYAQGGPAAGAATGAVGGAIVGGPIGAVVGGVGGAIVGGILEADRPRFRTYVQERKLRSTTWDGQVVVGGVLMPNGVEYYDVPSDYQVKTYRYAVVNGHTVLVDPATRKIVEIID